MNLPKPLLLVGAVALVAWFAKRNNIRIPFLNPQPTEATAPTAAEVGD